MLNRGIESWSKLLPVLNHKLPVRVAITVADSPLRLSVSSLNPLTGLSQSAPGAVGPSLSPPAECPQRQDVTPIDASSPCGEDRDALASQSGLGVGRQIGGGAATEMSALNAASIEESKDSGPAFAFQSVAVSLRSRGRMGKAGALGALVGAAVGLAIGAAGFLVAPNLAMPVLLAMGVFYGVFNGALLGLIVSVGDERPA